jgi:hypothetical protein
LDTSLLEIQLRSQLPSLLDGDQLLQLPLPVISRLLTPDGDSTSVSGPDHRQLFGFLVRCLDHFGPPASVLFSGFRVDERSAEEVGTLESHRGFRWSFLNDSVGTALSNLLGEISRERTALLTQTERQSGLLSDLSSRVEDLTSKLDRLSKEVDERFAATESRFEASIR